ncbi:MAG: single-stranded-DNA-specific exonuclease RecJ [bacterium]
MKSNKNKNINYLRIQGQKFLWRIKKTDEALVRSVAYDNNLSFAIAQTLCSRNLLDSDQIRSFLFSSYEQNVFDATLFKDAEKTVDRILHAIKKKEKILIFGDYDVDGITSTSLLLLALLPLGANVNFFLPNREKDGYGLSEKFVQKSAENSYKLIITVDNGISAIVAAKKAKELKIDLIITDHHRPQEELPEALAIVDPNQIDCEYPYKDLAGVGVSFKIIDLLYKKLDKKLPDKIYELLLLGSVADVVPLIGENRYWVRYGLTLVNKKRSLSLNSLIQNSGLQRLKLNSLDIGFMVAPQINALGRLDDPRQAVKFLISSEKNEVDRIGKVLRRFNEERKLVDRQIYLEIEKAILDKQINLEKENIIMAANTDWPSGVIGLVAGKLSHNFGKPTFLFHLDKKGIVKGSCRSIPEFNIFDALNENKDLLLSFGGHSYAAGLKLKQKDLPELKERLEEKIARELKPEDLIPKIDLDANLDFGEMKQKLLFDLDQLEPFGNQNMQPSFLIKNLTLLRQPQLLKDKHVKCSVFSQGVIKPLIFFNRPELYDFFSNIGDKSFDVAAHVVKNEWNDKINIELQGLDVALND